MASGEILDVGATFVVALQGEHETRAVQAPHHFPAEF
jgi:hypothetical protein